MVGKILILVLAVIIAGPVFGQNTKGDRPASSREGRFKTPSKKNSQKRKPGKRISVRKNGLAGDANYTPRRERRSGERPGRPIRPIARTKPQSKERAWTGDIAGRRIRAKSGPARSPNIYPQYGRYTHNPSREPKPTQNAVSNKSTLARLKRLQTPASARKVYPQKGRFVNNPSSTPRSTQNPSSNRATLARVKKLQSSPPRIYKRSLNVYAHFPRPKRKSERPYLKDIAGKALRRKNFETPRPGVVSPSFSPYSRRGKMGDKPYSGPSGGYRSASRKGQQAWQGDIRGRNFSSKRYIEGQPVLPTRRLKDKSGDGAYSGKAGWFRTATRSGESRPGLQPLPGRRPGIGANGIGNYQGNTRGGKPLKGGGSVSGRGWNNDGRPIGVRTPRETAAGSFQGNIKASRPVKGGGSVSGNLWNNGETPIPGKTYSPESKRVAGFPGRNKMFDLHPGFGDQGGNYTGDIKLKKRGRSYTQHPDAAEESIRKKKIDKGAFDAEGLQVKVKQGDYGRKPHAAEGAMPGIRPSKSSVKASEYARGMRRNWDYVRNPSSAEEALKTREPGKAFARASAYQGNIKMQKFKLFENRDAHPDTRFIKLNKNNVAEERDLLTNFKLWWARLFKKEDTQPDHLKEKEKRPRYDKGEMGMWNE